MRSIKILPLALLLVGCTQTEPSIVNEQPLRTALENREIVLASDTDVQDTADLWKRGGQGPVELISTYRAGNVGLANYNASSAAERLKRLGVTDVKITTIPASSNRVIANVTALTAGADKSCTQTPGMTSSVADYDYNDYRLGCGVDDRMGQQVARTADLEGRVPGQNHGKSSDASRQGNVVDAYRTGKGNEPLKGLDASDVAE